MAIPGWVTLTIAIGVFGLAIIGLLWLLSQRFERRDMATTTCIYCRDESATVCPHCANRKIHEELLAGAHAVELEDILGGEGSW